VARDQIRTYAGHAFDKAVHLCEAHNLARAQRKCLAGSDGGVCLVASQANGGVDEDRRVDMPLASTGGAGAMFTFQCGADDADILSGIMDFSYSPDVLADFVSFVTPLSFPDEPNVIVDLKSIADYESDILWHHLFLSPLPVSLLLDAHPSFAFKVYTGPRKHLDLSEEPLSYTEAMVRPDADAWVMAMEHEKKSLEGMGALEEVDLPSRERMID
jgi:hypothetical protein